MRNLIIVNHLVLISVMIIIRSQEPDILSSNYHHDALKRDLLGFFGLMSVVIIISLILITAIITITTTSIFIINITIVIIIIIFESPFEPAELIRAVRNSVGQSRSFSRAGNAVEIEMRN